jgi:intracellular sulfur oxidation DsrE/DsrF family protein
MNRFILAALMLTASLLLTSLGILASDRTYLEVSPEGSDDLKELLGTLQESLRTGLPADEPIVVVLHGSEALPFTRSGYSRNRDLVDQAALLDAYNLIDVRMCETWMNENGIGRDEIPAFIEVIPYAPEEIRRLESEGYLPHGSVSI